MNELGFVVQSLDGGVGVLGGTNAGGDDIFLAKYDSIGTRQWIKQRGTPQDDYAEGVAVDSLGNVYVLAGSDGNLTGVNAGSSDIFLLKYDTNGNLQ